MAGHARIRQPANQPEIENFTGAQVGQPPDAFQPPPAAAIAEPPDVSQLAPVEAARTLANWNYDRQNWTHAIEHYQAAIAGGAIIPMSGPILAIVFASSDSQRRRSNRPRSRKRKPTAREQSFQSDQPLCRPVARQGTRPGGRARLIARFPQSPQVELVRERMKQLQKTSKNDN